MLDAFIQNMLFSVFYCILCLKMILFTFIIYLLIGTIFIENIKMIHLTLTLFRIMRKFYIKIMFVGIFRESPWREMSQTIFCRIKILVWRIHFLVYLKLSFLRGCHHETIFYIVFLRYWCSFVFIFLTWFSIEVIKADSFIVLNLNLTDINFVLFRVLMHYLDCYWGVFNTFV